MLELRYDGEIHARGNIYIYAPAQKLFGRFPPAGSPSRTWPSAATSPAGSRRTTRCWRATSRTMSAGTWAGPGTRAEVLLQKEYMQGLFASCKQALGLTATGDPLSSAAVLQGAVELVNPGNPWAVFRGYLAVVVEYCGNATNKKWVGRLGVADVWGFDNAWTTVESLRIDYNVLGPFRNL